MKKAAITEIVGKSSRIADEYDFSSLTLPYAFPAANFPRLIQQLFGPYQRQPRHQ
jgi:hypothetical protein